MQEYRQARIRPSWQAVIGDTREIASDLLRLTEPQRRRRLQDHADALFSDLVHVGGAVFESADQVASVVPGYNLALRQVRRAEAALLGEVKRRIDELPSSPSGRSGTDARAQLLSELLNASMDTDPRRSEEQLHLRILRQLLPDEARILSTLSDGSRFTVRASSRPKRRRRTSNARERLHRGQSGSGARQRGRACLHHAPAPARFG